MPDKNKDKQKDKQKDKSINIFYHSICPNCRTTYRVSRKDLEKGKGSTCRMCNEKMVGKREKK